MRIFKGVRMSEEAFYRQRCNARQCRATATHYVLYTNPRFPHFWRVLSAYCKQDADSYRRWNHFGNALRWRVIKRTTLEA